ncbi:MAG: hypothetical protein ABSG67_01415 [Thermoguttaceae bacterium]|jgi:hypothetical protein
MIETIQFWLAYCQFALLTSYWFYPLLIIVFLSGFAVGSELQYRLLRRHINPKRTINDPTN